MILSASSETIGNIGGKLNELYTPWPYTGSLYLSLKPKSKTLV